MEYRRYDRLVRRSNATGPEYTGQRPEADNRRPPLKEAPKSMLRVGQGLIAVARQFNANRPDRYALKHLTKEASFQCANLGL